MRRQSDRVANDDRDLPVVRILSGRRHGDEPERDDDHRDERDERQSESHVRVYPLGFSPETMRAAPASLPLRISLMSATVSCSSAILVLKLSIRLCCAGSLVGSDRSAARLSLIA